MQFENQKYSRHRVDYWELWK